MRAQITLILTLILLGLTLGAGSLMGQARRIVVPWGASSPDSSDQDVGLPVEPQSENHFLADSSYVRTSIRTDFWDTTAGDWVQVYRNVSTFDSLHREIQMTYEDWTGSAWFVHDRTLTSYDGSGNLIVSRTQGWTGMEFQNSIQTIYGYGGDNLTDSILVQWWVDSAWVNQTLSQYTRDDNGWRVENLRRRWIDTSWTIRDRYKYGYDDSGRPTLIVFQTLSDTGFVNYSKQTYRYDVHGSRTENAKYRWVDNDWLLSSDVRYVIAYNDNGAPTERITQLWDGSGWSARSRSLYAYDGQGHQTDVLSQSLVDTSWVDASESQSTYYPAGNLKETIHRIASGGVMHDDSRQVFEWTLMLSSVTDLQGTAARFRLEENYPNPFNPSTTISYVVPTPSPVVLTIYDLLGRCVDVLVDERQEVGFHRVVWDARNIASGVYFYKLQAGNDTAVKKLMLLK